MQIDRLEWIFGLLVDFDIQFEADYLTASFDLNENESSIYSPSLTSPEAGP